MSCKFLWRIFPTQKQQTVTAKKLVNGLWLQLSKHVVMGAEKWHGGWKSFHFYLATRKNIIYASLGQVQHKSAQFSAANKALNYK